MYFARAKFVQYQFECFVIGVGHHFRRFFVRLLRTGKINDTRENGNIRPNDEKKKKKPFRNTVLAKCASAWNAYGTIGFENRRYYCRLRGTNRDRPGSGVLFKCLRINWNYCTLKNKKKLILYDPTDTRSDILYTMYTNASSNKIRFFFFL